MKLQRAADAALVGIAWSTLAAHAAADEDVVAACVRAAERAQHLQSERKLVEARAELVICGRPSCPLAVKRDCVEWIAAVDKSTPTVVFGARRGDEDLVDVEVRVDGQTVASKLDGKAIVLDPGVHVFTFASGGRQVEKRAVIEEGEKLRQVRVTFDSVRPEAVESHPTASFRPIPPLVYVVGAVAVVAFAGAVYFGTQGRAELDSLHQCAPSCSPSEVSALKVDMIGTDVSLGVGVLASSIATWLFFTRPAAARPVAAGAALLSW